MEPVELISYCRAHAGSIFVRVVHDGGWQTLPLSSLTADEVLEHLLLWIACRHTPVRVVGQALANPSPKPAP